MPGHHFLTHQLKSQLRTFLGNPSFVMGHGGLLTPTRFSMQQLQICSLPITKGVYHEACKDCLAIHENDWYKGGVCHSGCPLTQRSGDPTNATEYANSKAEFQKKDANYEKKGSSQLIPADLHFLQSAQLSSNTKFSICNSG